MLTKWCRVFPGLPEEVPPCSSLRRVPARGSGGPVQDAILIVSELATNAVRHTRSGVEGGWFLVVVGLGDDLVRIQVVDQGGDRVPHLCHATSHEEGGAAGYG